MRNLVLSVAALAALVVCACGASSKEVAMAKTARYRGDKLEIFAATKAAVEAKYTLRGSDETRLEMATEPKWYSPEGLTQNPRGEGTEMVDLVDKSINFGLVVALLPDGDNWIVKVTPMLLRYNRGIPKPEPLKEGDISLPGWVQSKTDEMAIDINKALSKWQLQTVPGNAPPANAPGAAPAAAPAPAPAPEPAPTPAS